MMKRSGFSLVELLVALAIIATLAAVGIPVTRSILANSRQAACLNQLRALGVGLQGYLQEHNNIMPDLVTARASKSEDVPVLDTVLLPYFENAEAFRCPADREQFAKTGCSYAWNSFVSGKRLSDAFVFGIREDQIPLIYDKEDWHPDGVNFLYPDMSGSNKIRFAAGN